MKNYIKREARINSPLYSIDDVNCDRPVSVEHLFERLSQEAQQVAEMVLENPEMFVSMEPQEARKCIAQKLTEQGWSMKQVWRGVQDLKLALSVKY